MITNKNDSYPTFSAAPTGVSGVPYRAPGKRPLPRDPMGPSMLAILTHSSNADSIGRSPVVRRSDQSP